MNIDFTTDPYFTDPAYIDMAAAVTAAPAAPGSSTVQTVLSGVNQGVDIFSKIMSVVRGQNTTGVFIGGPGSGVTANFSQQFVMFALLLVLVFIVLKILF